MQLSTQLKDRRRARLVLPAVAVICALLLSACQGNTAAPTEVGTTTATLNAQASCAGGVPTPCSFYWRWGTNYNYQYSSPISGPVSATWSGALSYGVTGLTPGTTYQYELCGKGDNIPSFACVGPTTFTTASSGSTTTTQPPATTTTTSTTSTTTTTSLPSSGSGSGGNCTSPIFSTTEATGTYNTDPGDGTQNWWVDNDAWSGSHGPQTINVCSASSWDAVSNQPDNGGQVETYPDTEYDVGGRATPSTKPISGFNSITSTFAEAYPSAGGWDAAYDLWTDNWTNETMIWNQWAGGNAYWAQCANNQLSGGCGTEPGVALTLNGVPYHFLANGPTNANGTPVPCTSANESQCEYMFFRDNQVTSGSVNILAAFQWEVANGYAKASDVPTQLQYGVEVAYTSGTETFPMTGLTFSMS